MIKIKNNHGFLPGIPIVFTVGTLIVLAVMLGVILLTAQFFANSWSTIAGITLIIFAGVVAIKKPNYKIILWLLIPGLLLLILPRLIF